MAVPLEKFIRQLEDSGFLAGDTLKDFLPPKADPKSAEELALDLVRKNKLTKFQAEEISKGKGKSLTLGNYVLMEKIGAGGMGQVFKARHRVMNRDVAIKVLPTSLMKDEAAVARFHREVQAAAKLNHPNIVTAYDADQSGDVHFLVMELVEGSDLSAIVKKNGPFAVETAINYILQTAQGLEAAHAEGIVHRDIKPANLLLDKKGTVKILDMGLARLGGDGDAAPQTELTNTGTIMGTVDYMSPEQAMNSKNADHRSDIYSLGISLYYLLNGKVAYNSGTVMERLLAHRDQPIPSLRESRPEVPAQLEPIFQRMVAKNAKDRYQSMSDVIADLDQLPHVKQELASSSAAVDPAPVFSFDTEFATSSIPMMRSQKKKRSPIGSMIGGGAAVAVVLLVAVLMSTGGQSSSQKERIEQVANLSSPATPTQTTTTPAAATPKIEAKPAAVQNGSTVDLIKQIDLQRDKFIGRWSRDGTTLTGHSGSILYLPAKPPEDYQLKFSAMRTEGAGMLTIGFVMAGHAGAMILDAFSSKLSGVLVDGVEPDSNNCTTRYGALFKNNQLSTIEVTVHPGRLHVVFDGQTIADWSGTPDRLFLNRDYCAPDRQLPFIGAASATFRIESAVMIPLEPESH